MSFQMTRTRQDATTNLAVKRHLQRWRITGNRGGRRITKTWRRGCRRRRRCCSGRQCWWWWHLGFTRVLQSSNTGKKIERVPVFSTSWRTETRQRCRRRWTGGLLFTHSTIRKKRIQWWGRVDVIWDMASWRQRKLRKTRFLKSATHSYFTWFVIFFLDQ